MPNPGEKKVHFKTKDGLNSSITFQVTKVKKPLAAVSKITEKGNWVCFGPSASYIENVVTGKRTNLELHNALTAWTWSTSMSQVSRGWTGGKELDKTVQTCGGVLAVLGTQFLSGSAHGCCQLPQGR